MCGGEGFARCTQIGYGPVGWLHTPLEYPLVTLVFCCSRTREDIRLPAKLVASVWFDTPQFPPPFPLQGQLSTSACVSAQSHLHAHTLTDCCHAPVAAHTPPAKRRKYNETKGVAVLLKYLKEEEQELVCNSFRNGKVSTVLVTDDCSSDLWPQV